MMMMMIFKRIISLLNVVLSVDYRWGSWANEESLSIFYLEVAFRMFVLNSNPPLLLLVDVNCGQFDGFFL